MKYKKIYEHFSEIVKKSTSSDIALTMQDIDDTLRNKDIVFFDLIECKNIEDLLLCVKKALKIPNSDESYYTDSTTAIIINFHIPKNFPMLIIMDVMNFIYASMDEEADAIWTTSQKNVSDSVEISVLVMNKML